MTNAIATILTAAGNLWGNAVIRYTLILGAVGFVPFYFLTLATSQLSAVAGGN